MVIAARNPVHSVLFLILCFVNAAGLFMLAGAEFLALIETLLIDGPLWAVAPLAAFEISRPPMSLVRHPADRPRILPRSSWDLGG